MDRTGETPAGDAVKTVRLPEETLNGHRYACLRIGTEDAGREVLYFLKNILGMSASGIGTVKFDPVGMLLNGVRVNVRAKTAAGDLLRIRTDDPKREQKLIPYDAPLRILYEDHMLLSVDKSAGVVCHPSPGHAWDSLSNRVRAYYDRTAPDLSVHIAGRLDRDTSGVVVFSKNSMVSAALQKQQYSGDYVKEYLALVHGVPEPRKGVIRTRVDKFREQTSGLLLLKRADEGEGQDAETAYEVVSENGGFSLLRVTIRTGRMHQIRFHMSDSGHPLLFDPLYGGMKFPEKLPEDGIFRTALHAWRVTLKHPEDGHRLTVTSPVPEDLLAFMKLSGLPDPGIF